MWIKAKKTKLNEYNINVITQRKMADDEHIMHMELTDNPEFYLAVRFDPEVKLYLEEEMNTLISEVNGNEPDAIVLAEREALLVANSESNKNK